MATLSTETQAIIDRLVREGELLRNDGAHSIKSVKETITVEFAKFAGIFDEMKVSLGGLSEQGAANLAIAQEEAKLRGLTEQERLDYLRTQGEMEQRKQELENQRLKREENDSNKKEKGPGVLSTIKGFFGGITDFFKKAALLLAGGVIAYEFIAGMIEEKFGIKIPTIIAGFEKLGEFLKSVDWKKLGIAIAGIIAVSVSFKAALLVLGGAIAAISAINLVKSVLPGGRPPIIPPTPGAPAGAPQRNFTIDRDGNPISNKTGKILQGGARETALRVEREDAANRRAGRRGSLLGKIAGNKGKLALGVLSAAGVGYVAGGTDNTTLDATAGQEDLLAAINERNTSLMDVLSETASSAAVGGTIGGTLGLAGLGAGAVPGAITGAISGAVWGFATSVALVAKRAFDDMGEGIDELPNSVEAALREEKAVFEAGMEGRVEAIKATAQATSEFLKQNQSKLEETQKEIASIQGQINAEGASEGLKSSLRARLDGLNTDLELLQKQNDVSASILQKKNLELQNQTVLPASTNTAQLDQVLDMVAQGGNGSAGTVIVHKQGDVTNVQTTNAQRTSSVAYKHTMNGFGGGGSRFEAIPGMFAMFA